MFFRDSYVSETETMYQKLTQASRCDLLEVVSGNTTGGIVNQEETPTRGGPPAALGAENDGRA